VLMPGFWYRKHRSNAKVVPGDPPKTPELDPDAKTIIFSMKMKLGDKLTVLFVGLVFGLVAKVLWLVKTVTFGAVNFEGFWFPAPFFNFWESKLLIKGFQINGCKIRTKASQDDAYMRFCTEACFNFWTFGFYQRCCAKKNSYERWLDRSLVWVGKPPSGFNNQFRIFDEKMKLCQKIRIYGFSILLTMCGGFLKYVPLIGGLWPVGQILEVYLYKVKLSNMKFGGSDPYFGPEFTYCNYVVKFYTIAICGLCGMPLKKWVDAQIELSKPQFDQEMADEDAEIDAADAAQDLPPTVFAPPVVQVQNQTDVPQTELTATDVP